MDKILINDYKVLKNNDFSSAQELKDYTLLNKEVFCREVLGFEYKSHVENHIFETIPHLFDEGIEVGLIFTDQEDQAHIVELKAPANTYLEGMQGIGQCLTYFYLARVQELNLVDVCLVTTKHCNLVPLVIRDGNLPVRYIYFSKENWAEKAEME
jgi:hypothetical protein